MGLSSSDTLAPQVPALPVLATNHYHRSLRPRKALVSLTAKQYEEWQQSLSKLGRFGEYLRLPERYVWKVDCVCSDVGSLELEYQDCIYSLQEEIGQRSALQEQFKEHELWYILFLVITIQFALAPHLALARCAIHPSTLVITPSGNVKLLYTLRQEQQFVPPEEIPFLLMQLIASTDERVTMRINKEISETFQLGLTLLSAATLKDCSSLYRHAPLLSLDLDQLAQELEQCADSAPYTLVLTSLIANLCSFNPAHRLSGPELWEWVHDHEEEIKRRAAFNFRYLPRKLSLLVERRVRRNQEKLLRSSRLKLERLSSSQASVRRTEKSPERSSHYERDLYLPIHEVSAPSLPSVPRHRSGKY